MSELLDVFYPIVPDAGWVARLVPLGIRTIQLRIKDRPPKEIEREIGAALAVAADHRCQLIVNDHWREASAMGADFVHLGQEDLAAADLHAIKAAGLKLGLSTHSEEELETALAAEPDYVALGPIYETRLKIMRWPPQGLQRISEWRQRIGSLPLVAIGGITPERAGAILSHGADSVAVITDFMSAPNPDSRIRLWLEWAEIARRRSPN